MNTKRFVAVVVLATLLAFLPAAAIGQGGTWPNCYDFNVCYYMGSTGYCYFTGVQFNACRYTYNQYGTFCSNLSHCWF